MARSTRRAPSRRCSPITAPGSPLGTCADHYGPAEDFIGTFRRQFAARYGEGRLAEIQAFTKWVPRPARMTRRTVEEAIGRSLALRPAHSRGHQVVTAIRRLQPFRYLHDCSDCFRRERIAGWALTHLSGALVSSGNYQ